MRRLFVFALLVVAVSVATTMPAAAKPRGLNGKIALNSDNNVTGQEQVYLIDPDGSNRQLLANDAETGQWSPDGTKLACCGGVMNPDTGILGRRRSTYYRRCILTDCSSVASGHRTVRGLLARVASSTKAWTAFPSSRGSTRSARPTAPTSSGSRQIRIRMATTVRATSRRTGSSLSFCERRTAALPSSPSDSMAAGLPGSRLTWR